MKKLISFLKTEFPKDTLDIQECIDLLNQCIGGSVESIKGAFSAAIDKRDYQRLTNLQEILQSIDKVQVKLEEYSNLLQLDDEIEEEIIQKENLEDESKELPDYDSLRVDQNIPYTLYDDYTHKRPAGFEIFGMRQDAKDWKEVLIKTCEILAGKDPVKFSTFVNDKSMQGRKVSYFCNDQKGIRAPRHVKGTDIYLMTNMSANQVRNVIERMLRRYEIKINNFIIYLKADYTARHE
ncbi:hypothetical protein [Clostridium sp. C8-1-8]|uniref:hypothetical protein n=1 Tax=Clostridium sp. C8-1-8 TaxID=2698831 RepID=UPI001370D587|nr:hypothetical protein [Clostridium sp. C8-1-8]